MVVNVSPTDDSEEKATDGGSVDRLDVFTRTSDIPSRSRLDQTRQGFEEHLFAPLRVAWDDWRARTGIVILGCYILVGTVGVMVVPQPESLQGPILAPPFQTWEFPLGTDVAGSGLLRQTVHATPAMFKMILSGALLSIVLGTVIGTLAGYSGGYLDRVLMTVTDIVLTIPGLALIIVLSAVWVPRDPYVVGLILGIDNWPGLARTLRSQVLSIREEDFLEASRTMGLSKFTILRKGVISRLMPYISINMANSAKRIIFESVGLYFLAILPFTTLNWGVVMQMAYQQANLRDPSQLHWMLVPMLAIAGLSFGLVMFAQGLDRVFNVRLRARHAKTVPDGDGGTEPAKDT